MSDGPDTLRPANMPRDMGALVSEALDVIARELDEQRDALLNGNREIIEAIGENRAKMNHMLEANSDAHASTQAMCRRILSQLEQDREDREKMNDRILSLEKKARNGHTSA